MKLAKRFLPALCLVSFLSTLGLAQEPPRLRDVKSWRGTIVGSVSGSEITTTGGGHSLIYKASFVCEVLVDQFDTDTDSGVTEWSGKVLSSNLESSYDSLTDAKGSNMRKVFFHTEGPLELPSGPQAKLIFHGERGWSWELIKAQRKGEVFLEMPKTKPPLRRQEIAYICGLPKPYHTAVPYPAKGLILFGSGTTGPAAISFSPLQIMGGVVLADWEWTAYFEPTSVEELRLEISEPEGYETWRPETTPQRGKGPGLDVKATLVSSKGGTPNTRVKSFLWELKGTSAEKGVALNFPLEGGDTDFDLELEPRGADSRLFDKKQKLERTVEGTFTDTVGIAPYDWGGWSTLQVTAILADGRRIVGKLKGKSDLGIRLPKREANSHIAEGWKKDHTATGDDADDDEKMAGHENDGDGYTLYEEYRGWVMNGEHVTGDPQKKDFFVLNLIGGDAEPGIDLFAGLSQLNVHSKLRPTEMSEEQRLMNGNHNAGAHRVDQHGVWLKTFTREALGDTGADTPMTEAGVAGRPGITKGIGILARDNVESVFNQPFNLPANDTAFAFDRAIAHELLHSVGVDHHGTGDYRQIVGYVSTRNPANKTGRAYYGSSVDKPLPLLDESDQDVAEQDYGAYVALRQMMDLLMKEPMLKEGREFLAAREGYDIPIKTPEQYADSVIELLAIYAVMVRSGTVGVEHGEHSGDQDCVMRYYFAKFYEAKNRPEKTLYVVTPGSERIGLTLCHAGTGTGINGQGHKPQSRYGDAAAGEGGCFAKICPNDAIPPRSLKK